MQSKIKNYELFLAYDSDKENYIEKYFQEFHCITIIQGVPRNMTVGINS